ncbi:MAG: hypothetical protein AAF479_15625 [Pseudomonadota bacterium]
MEEQGKFWMVWNPNGRAPTYCHPTRDSANREAERLAEENPGQQFIILKAVGGFEVQRPPARPIDMAKFTYDNIPF